jgi:hypothetical protein
MKRVNEYLSSILSLLLILGAFGLEGCRSKDKGTTAAPQAANQPTQAAPAAENQAQTQLPAVSLTADGLDELLAPVALYPDPVLAVMLQASEDPQEVMDGGNWLVLPQNQTLKDAALDQASSKAGFTPVMQALLHFGPVVDMMCTQFDWTKQLGAAYQEDPKAVLASIQRLRAQAVDNGALKSSSQMKVDVKQDQGAQVVEIAPADPKVVYVPQYDPAQVYEAPAATTTTAPATSTTVVQESSGVSTGTAVLIGLLSFGAGMAVGSAINNNNYYYPAWGYGGVYYGGRPYYPPPYRPVYGGGWGGGYGYNRPVHYGNNVYINNSHNNYYNRFNNNNNLKAGYRPQPVHYNNRPGSVSANNIGNRADARRGVTANNRVANTNNGNFRGQSTYQGANRGVTPGQQNRLAAGSAGAANNVQRAAGGGASDFRGKSTYQGARPNAMNSNAANRAGGNAGRAAAPSASVGAGNRGGMDRGYGEGGARGSTGNARASRGQPAARQVSQPASRPSSSGGGAFGGANNAHADRAASARGHQSMGAPARSSGQGARKR